MSAILANVRTDVTPKRLTALADTAVKGISERKFWGLELIRYGAVGINARGSLGVTPLFAACYALWLPGVKELLAMGADAEKCGLSGGNAAQAAFIAAVDRHERFTANATDKACVEILQTLLEHGVSLAYCRKTEADVALLRLRHAAEAKHYVHLVLKLMNMTLR